MKEIEFSCRDNGRTPFQWDSGVHAGFTTGEPWIKVNGNYRTVNEAREEKDPNSTLNYFRKITRLRNANKTLVYGKYTLLDKDNPKVYAYTREWNGNKLLILLNFSKDVATAETGIKLSNAKILLDNYAIPSKSNKLQPYEAVIYQLR
jgi:oligo-1,6-glucosidase